MALSMMGGAALADEEYVYGTANLTRGAVLGQRGSYLQRGS